jgi:hypothetical protein
MLISGISLIMITAIFGVYHIYFIILYGDVLIGFRTFMQARSTYKLSAVVMNAIIDFWTLSIFLFLYKPA